MTEHVYELPTFLSNNHLHHRQYKYYHDDLVLYRMQIVLLDEKFLYLGDVR